MNLVIILPFLGLLNLCQVLCGCAPAGRNQLSSSLMQPLGLAVPRGDKGWHHLNAAQVRLQPFFLPVCLNVFDSLKSYQFFQVFNSHVTTGFLLHFNGNNEGIV